MHHLTVHSEYFYQSEQVFETIKLLIQSLEALAWLHGCQRMQVVVEILGADILKKCDYWEVKSKMSIHYNKNFTNGFKILPQKTQDIIT